MSQVGLQVQTERRQCTRTRRGEQPEWRKCRPGPPSRPDFTSGRALYIGNRTAAPFAGRRGLGRQFLPPSALCARRLPHSVMEAAKPEAAIQPEAAAGPRRPGRPPATVGCQVCGLDLTGMRIFHQASAMGYGGGAGRAHMRPGGLAAPTPPPPPAAGAVSCCALPAPACVARQLTPPQARTASGGWELSCQPGGRSAAALGACPATPCAGVPEKVTARPLCVLPLNWHPPWLSACPPLLWTLCLQRYHICSTHLMSEEVLWKGVPQRFCQQVRGAVEHLQEGLAACPAPAGCCHLGRSWCCCSTPGWPQPQSKMPLKPSHTLPTR